MLKATDIIEMAFSYEDGILMRDSISKELENKDMVTVDFSGIDVFTTMFFNACAAYFIVINSEKWFKNHIQFTNLNDLGTVTCNHSIKNAVNKVGEVNSDKRC